MDCGVAETRGALPTDRWRLTTFRHGGTAVERDVECAEQDGRLYARLGVSDPVVERLWEEPLVRIAPYRHRGRRAGPPIEATARVLRVEEEHLAVRALQRARREPPRFLRGLLSRAGSGGLYVEIVP
jgi:PPOX class probable F420-dependent enzyme